MQLINQLVDSRQWLLLSDFDGSLVPIVKTPEAVLVSGKLLELLNIINKKMPFYIISGRSKEQLSMLLADSDIEVCGEHGADCVPHYPNDSDIMTEIVSLLRTEILWPEVFLEIKEHSVAVHYRANVSCSDSLRAGVERVAARFDDYSMMTGKCVFEIIHCDCNKGIAANYYMKKNPRFRAIYVGDDRTDEDAFEAVNSAAGVSIRIGYSESSKANFYLPNVESYYRFLLLNFG